MSVPNAGIRDKIDLVDGPPEESFDEKYNKHFEFPLSVVGTVFFHVIVGAGLVFTLLTLLSDGEKPSVPVKLVNLTGLDDAGEGSPGSGGDVDPFFKDNHDPIRTAVDSPANPSRLPEIKEKLRKEMGYDRIGNLPISNENVDNLRTLEKTIRGKLFDVQQGAGPGRGKGPDISPGGGPGGTGADSTLGRTLRWVLRFKVASGRDYLDQLRTMGAEMLFPQPNSVQSTLIPDLNKPNDRKLASDDDLRRLAEKVKFSDSRQEAVRGVSQELKLEFTPNSIWAFFPRELEEELAKKEKAYRNKRAEDIEETIFRVTVRNGKYEIEVVEQKFKN